MTWLAFYPLFHPAPTWQVKQFMFTLFFFCLFLCLCFNDILLKFLVRVESRLIRSILVNVSAGYIFLFFWKVFWNLAAKRWKTLSAKYYWDGLEKIRVSDPDPHGSALIWAVGSGRIQIADPDPDPGGEKWHKKIEKRTEFSSFEVLDVHFWGLKASPVAWASFMEA